MAPSRVFNGLVDDEQDLPQCEQERKRRVFVKLIRILGLDDHNDRISKAITFQRIARLRPKWLHEYNYNDVGVAVVINQPIDLTFDMQSLGGIQAEYAASNTALFYIWLDGLFPQEVFTDTSSS